MDVTPMRPRPRTVWPTAVGVIAIVFGSLGVFSYGCATPLFLIGMAILPMPDPPPPGMEPTIAQFEVMRDFTAELMASTIVSTGLAVMLLVGGVQLVKRRRRNRRLLRIWSVLKIVAAIPGVWIGAVLQQAQMDAMEQAAQQSGAPNAGFYGFLGDLAYLQVAIGLMIAVALPVFLLIWFARGPIREEIDAWQ